MSELPNYYSDKNSLPFGFELKKIKNFQIGIIYKIIDKRDGTIIYIGSTIQSPNDRWLGHLSSVRHDPAPVHKHMKDQGVKNFEFQIHLRGKWDNDLQMRKCETYWYIELEPTHNAYIPAREGTKEEYTKQYREDNKEHIQALRKDTYEKNKVAESEYAAQYYNENRETILPRARENSRKYYEKNKEKVNAKVICDECGEKMNKRNLKRHKDRKH